MKKILILMFISVLVVLPFNVNADVDDPFVVEYTLTDNIEYSHKCLGGSTPKSIYFDSSVGTCTYVVYEDTEAIPVMTKIYTAASDPKVKLTFDHHLESIKIDWSGGTCAATIRCD